MENAGTEGLILHIVGGGVQTDIWHTTFTIVVKGKSIIFQIGLNHIRRQYHGLRLTVLHSQSSGISLVNYPINQGINIRFSLGIVGVCLKLQVLSGLILLQHIGTCTHHLIF